MGLWEVECDCYLVLANAGLVDKWQWDCESLNLANAELVDKRQWDCGGSDAISTWF